MVTAKLGVLWGAMMKALGLKTSSNYGSATGMGVSIVNTSTGEPAGMMDFSELAAVAAGQASKGTLDSASIDIRDYKTPGQIYLVNGSVQNTPDDLTGYAMLEIFRTGQSILHRLTSRETAQVWVCNYTIKGETWGTWRTRG